MSNETTLNVPSDAESSAPKLKTYFCISGRDFDPAMVTSAIGLEPSEVWKQKHEHLLHRKDIPNTCWSLGREKQQNYSVSEAVDEVLDLIWPKRAEIKKFVMHDSFDVGIDCSVTIWDDRPVYDLSAKVIKRLADLGCEFGLDIYDYSS